MSPTGLDTTNYYQVGGQGDRVRIRNPAALLPLTKAQALSLATWLVAIADPAGADFEALLAAVKET